MDGGYMNPKLPYYMAYPMPLAYDDERIERRDYEYMKSLYPSIAKKILPYVEEECDRMEYHNSMIFDEFPDKLQLRLMCKRVYENVMKNEKIFYNEEYGGKISLQEPSVEVVETECKTCKPPMGVGPQEPNQPPMGVGPQEPNRPPMGVGPQEANRPPMGVGPQEPNQPSKTEQPVPPMHGPAIQPPPPPMPRSGLFSYAKPVSAESQEVSVNAGNNMQTVDPKWLQDFIEVLVYQELFKRRSDNRRNIRKFY
jgi:hypothetical protein